MRTEKEIIEYLGLDYENKKEKWFKNSIKIAKKIEKEFCNEIKNNIYGYGLTSYFENRVLQEMLEDLREYNLIKIKDYNGYITVYRKEVL